MKTKVAIYCRVSTLLGQSLENQLIPLRDFAANRGFVVVEEYCDEGISGTKASRPALDKMMKDAQAGRFSILVVAALDRCSRSTRHMLELVDELQHYGVSLISLRENLDFTSPTGRMALTVLAAVSALERSIIAERIKTSLAAKKIQAERTGSGWRVGRPPISEQLIQQILRLRADGLSIRAIERKLNRAVSKASICRILNEQLPHKGVSKPWVKYCSETMFKSLIPAIPYKSSWVFSKQMI